MEAIHIDHDSVFNLCHNLISETKQIRAEVLFAGAKELHCNISKQGERRLILWDEFGRSVALPHIGNQGNSQFVQFSA